jgi:hypothetical protein
MLFISSVAFAQTASVKLNDAKQLKKELLKKEADALYQTKVEAAAQFEKENVAIVANQKQTDAGAFEADPKASGMPDPSDYIFDFQFEVPLVNPDGVSVGIETDGVYIYTCHWQNSNIYRYDLNGVFIESFDIGAALIRDLAYNPNNGYFYGAGASTTVFEMDFTQGAEALVSTIIAPTAIRAIGFDDDNDWLFGNNWSTNVSVFNLAGVEQNNFAVNANSYYGFAYDNFTSGGPYFWGFAQLASGSREFLFKLDPVTGVEIGGSYDIGTALGHTDPTNELAGGLAITPPGTFPTVDPGEWSIFGITQNTWMWAVELGEPSPCPSVSELYTDNATGTAATGHWTDAAAAGTYDIVWGDPGFDPDLGPYTGTAYGQVYGPFDPLQYVMTGLTLGNSYDWYVRADCGANGYSSWAMGSFASYPPPANDECVNAELVPNSYPYTTTGSTLGATVDCPGILDWNAVWYEVTLPYASNSLNVDYCGTLTDVPTVGVVYYADCSDCGAYTVADESVFVDCGIPGGITTAYMNFEDIAGPGTIFFPAYLGDAMDFTVTFDVTEYIPPLPPPNDLCVDATAIGEVTDLAWSTLAATADPIGTCITTPNVFYNYTATVTGDVMVSLCGTTWDTKLAVYDSFDCGTMVQIACNDDSGPDCSGLQSSIQLTGVTAGDQFKIEVGGYSTVGDGILNVFEIAAAVGCQFTSQYPSSTITVDPGAALTTISTCNFAGEYSVVTGFVTGETYEFTLEDLGTGAYVTITDGPPTGANILAEGPSPLSWTATSNIDLYAHWSLDDLCTTDASCHETTVQCLTCTPTSYTVSGTMTYTGGGAMEGVTVNLMDGVTMIGTATTDAAGLFEFFNVPDGNYTYESASPFLWGGLNVVDIIFMKIRLANNTPPVWDPIMSEIAADVNGPGVLNIVDLLMMQLRAGNLEAPAWTNEDWLFEPVPVTVAGADVVQDVRSICGGDVNYTYVPELPPAPDNDECVNAEFVGGPYPQTITASNEFATIDCAGVLDWEAVWYEVDLPYGANDLHVDYCGSPDQATIGIVYYPDCSDCGAYVVADAYSFYDCGTPGGVTVGQMDFSNIVGPTTILFPVYQDPLQEFTVTFDVTEWMPPVTYCDAATTAEDECIGDVICGTINNLATGWQGGVADYTAQSTSIAAGSSEAITVNSGCSIWTSDIVTVWVDWGNDFVFDQLTDEEFLLTNDGTGATFTGNIAVPAGTPSGTYRMRVRMTYSTAPTPCGTASYGEVEDYSIVVP